MNLRTDVPSQWRDQHISRAVRLQSRWREVSERERRAQLHNRKLLQDFQRAQETLSDLVARTEAMNTIRVEYERYLEESFPQWQQKLKNKRLSEQRKRIEEHLKACMQQMERDQRMDRGNKSPLRTNSTSSISPDPSHPSISHPIPSDYRDMQREVHGRSALSRQDNKQSIQRNSHDAFQHFSVPITWLTQSQPSVTDAQQDSVPKETKTFQNIHQALNSSWLLPGDPRQDLHPVIQQEPPNIHHLSQYPKSWAGGVQWDPAGAPWSALPMVNPMVWRMMGMSESAADGMQCNEEVNGEKQMKSSSGPPLKKHQVKNQRRKVVSSDQSSELDTKSVHLSGSHGDSSESRALSCEAATSFFSGMQKKKRERRREKPTIKTETVSRSSSSMSDVRSSRNSEKDMSNLSSPVRNFENCKQSKTKVRSATGAESPKHPEEASETESKRTQETLKSSPSAVEKKKKKKRGHNKKDDMEEKDHNVQEKKSERVEGSLSEDGENNGEEEEREGPSQKAQDEEQKREGSYDERNDRGDRDEEETDEGVDDKALRSNASEGGSLSENPADYVGEREVDDRGEEEDKDGEEEEEDGGEEYENGGEEDEEDSGEEKDNDGREEEEEDGGEEEEEEDGGEEEEEGSLKEEEDAEEDEKEKGKKKAEAEEINAEARAPRRRKEGNDESGEEANDSEAAASGSGINMRDSLKELYKDEETEDEDLYDQEIEDDIEDDEDDVVVEKAYPWSRDPAYDYTKYQEDDYNDDVEGLLAPQNNVQRHQADEEEETVKPKDLHSDSEEASSHRKASLAPVKDESADSDDEFDHFYD